MAKKPPAPSDLADKFMLRLPDGMRDRIAEAAEANKRSMNAEIVARLEASFGDLVPRKDLEDAEKDLVDAENVSAVFFNTIIKLATDKDHPLVKRFGENMTLLEFDQLISEVGKEPPIFSHKQPDNT